MPIRSPMPAAPPPQQPLSQEAADFLHSQSPAVQDDLRSQMRTRTQDPESYLRERMVQALALQQMRK